MKIKKIAHYLCSKLNIEKGNLFIVERENKFYCEKMNDIYVLLDGKEEELSEILPPRDYKKMYGVVAFYIFCEDEMRDDVKKYFLDFFKENMDK